jgi:hypothetical protein
MSGSLKNRTLHFVQVRSAIGPYIKTNEFSVLQGLTAGQANLIPAS